MCQLVLNVLPATFFGKAMRLLKSQREQHTGLKLIVQNESYDLDVMSLILFTMLFGIFLGIGMT